MAPSAHCERDYGPAAGPRSVKHYAQTIMEIANLLTAVGNGTSLRLASGEIRHSARRFIPGAGVASRQNVLAARYLDAYGPSVLSRVLPDHWPRLLVLDSKPLGIRPYGAVEWGQWSPAMPGGGLLAAAGRDEETGVSRIWRISLGGDETPAFLGALPRRAAGRAGVGSSWTGPTPSGFQSSSAGRARPSSSAPGTWPRTSSRRPTATASIFPTHRSWRPFAPPSTRSRNGSPSLIWRKRRARRT